MKIIQKEIEDWIKPFATIVGEPPNVEKQLREINPLKYFLRITVPNRFEKYAIALHSFWINNEIPESKIGESGSEEEFPEEDFERIKWKDFFEIKGKIFDLKTAYKSTNGYFNQFKQMNNELYPGEGLMDKEHIQLLIKIVLDLYGNQEIEVFYMFLATNDWEKNRIYQGKISELNCLLDNKELRLTPSLIYPKDKNWVVNTDYDLSFSFIGGEMKLIDRLVIDNKDEIFELKY